MIFNYLGEWVSIHYDDRIAWVVDREGLDTPFLLSFFDYCLFCFW